MKETIVDLEKKEPKTASGNREVFLLPPALEALNQQKTFTFLNDNGVFYNPRTKKPWVSSKELYYVWKLLLRRAKVRYCNRYQTRHTYASMMISSGENVM